MGPKGRSSKDFDLLFIFVLVQRHQFVYALINFVIEDTVLLEFGNRCSRLNAL